MTGRLARVVALSLLLSVAGLTLVVWLGPPFDARVLRTANPLWLAASVVSAAGIWFGLASFRVALLCREQGVPLSLFDGLRANALTLLGAMVTPSGTGGAPAMALALATRGMTSAQGWAVAVGIFAIDTLFFAWSVPLALAAMLVTGSLPVGSVWIPLGGAAVAVSAAIAYLLLFRVAAVKAIVGLVFRGPLLRLRKRATRSVESFIEASEAFPKRSASWHLTIQTLTLVSWMGLFAALPLVASAFGPATDPIGLAAFELVLMAVASVVPTPGASGFFEAGTGAMLIQLDPTLQASAITLTWRIVTYYLFFIICPPLGGHLVAQVLARDP